MRWKEEEMHHIKEQEIFKFNFLSFTAVCFDIICCCCCCYYHYFPVFAAIAADLAAEKFSFEKHLIATCQSYWIYQTEHEKWRNTTKNTKSARWLNVQNLRMKMERRKKKLKIESIWNWNIRKKKNRKRSNLNENK